MKGFSCVETGWETSSVTSEKLLELVMVETPHHNHSPSLPQMMICTSQSFRYPFVAL